MAIWREFFVYLEGNRYATIVILGTLAGEGLSWGIGGKLKSAGLYAALSLAFVCAQILFFLVYKWEAMPLYFALSIEGILFGVFYGLLFAYVAVKNNIKERRARREEEKYRLQFVLPDKENAYLQDRLRTALNVVECEGKKGDFSADKESVGVRLRYTRRMVAKLKETALSPIERLDIEEMASTLVLMERKGKWSSAEVKMINEIFSRLLKLSAKYEIAV